MGDQPYYTLRTRRPGDGNSMSSGDSAYGSSAGDERTPSATHDISRVNYHVKHISDFAKTLEDSAARAFPNRGRSQRYQKVQSLLLHWKSDDLFVLPELEDLEQCLRADYSFETETYAIPSDNSHLELMLKVAQMIKEHESTDTLFVIYYGGHARIDESRQSTWCATRSSDSPWLQWSAIQTLLERSLSDVLILLDCCAGAASATFPSGNSITETISASSWDAIAPDPGRYSFTNALIEVLQEWKNRTFSAAMLHAEVLARLKHPRPIMLNGKHFEARSTPVHFMMTSNHKAPSIEMCRVLSSDQRPPSPPQEPEVDEPTPTGRAPGAPEAVAAEPNEDTPHVMISLALEDDQRLDLGAWENWLAAFPAIAKYVKVQGVFKSHSTLLLLSLPVMVWDLLPENLACNFIAFIRSNNLAVPAQAEKQGTRVVSEDPAGAMDDATSIYSGTTMNTWAGNRLNMAPGSTTTPSVSTRSIADYARNVRGAQAAPFHGRQMPPRSTPASTTDLASRSGQGTSAPSRGFNPAPTILTRTASSDAISRQMIMNQQRSGRRTFLTSTESLPSRPDLASHVQTRLEEYFQNEPSPTVAVKEFLASNLGIETADIDWWFYHRKQQQAVSDRLQNLQLDERGNEMPRQGGRMILAGHLNKLLEVLLPSQVVLVDLRSSTEYERSHIHGAINFRAPATFIQRADFEMIEKTFADDASRISFNNWYASKCVVFYDRHIEFPWECPSGETLLQKFKSKGWHGHGFILKGHYREFSESFNKYIGGTRISDAGRDHLESLRARSVGKRKDNLREYDEWLKLVEEEDQTVSSEPSATTKAERMEATLRHQKDLEAEIEERFPGLYRKALDVAPEPALSDRKVAMVPALERGLAKMREAGGISSPGSAVVPPPSYPPEKRDKLTSEDFDFVDSDDEMLNADTAHRKAGGKLADEAATSPGEVKKGRSRGLLRMLRSPARQA